MRSGKDTSLTFYGRLHHQVIVLVVMFSVLLLASGAIQLGRSVDAATPTSQTDHSGITTQWLSQQTQIWKPTTNSSINFQVLFSRASYGDLEYSYNNMSVQLADLSMIVSTGAGCVRVDINYAPWLQNNQTEINELTTLISQIRADGKCLVIADSASESYRNGGQISWTQFQAAWIQRDRTLAQLYHPDYFIVVKEPGWYVSLVSDSRTNPSFQSASSWLNLTQTLASTVLSVSPNTKVGVSVAADSLSAQPSFYTPFITGLYGQSNISFVGYDVYDVTGFTNTQNFLDQNGNGGKNVWIAEAWDGGGNFIYDSSQAQLDQQWMLVLYYFAEHIHASAVMPFYTDLFSSYNLTNTYPTDPAQIISLYGQQTPVYSEFKAIVAASPLTSTSSTSSTNTTSQSTHTSSSSQTITSTTSSSNTVSTTSSTSPPPPVTGKLPRLSILLVIALIIVIVVAVSVGLLLTRRRQT